MRALFLDRDGVINVDHGYVGRVDDFDFIDGVFDVVRAARSLGFVPIVATNQSGIGRGYFSEADFEALTSHMLARFMAEGAPLEKVYVCPSHPEATIERHRLDDPRRKPGPGMLLDAIRDLDLDASRSAMLGDQWSDALAAHAAGVRSIALVGEPKLRAPAHLPAVVRLAEVRDAVGWLERLASAQA